jgi:lysophospholipase L1-like esterase
VSTQIQHSHLADPLAHLFSEPRSNLRAFFAAIANRANAPVDIVFMGDSITEGAGASTKGNRWQDLLRDALRAKWQPAGIVGGEGYVPAYSYYNNRFTYTGTTTQPSTDGLGLLGITMSTSATATLTFTGTALDVFVANQSGGGTVTVAVDGAASGTGFASISTAAGVKTNGVATRVGGLTAGAHTVVITCTAGPVIFEGVMVYNGDESLGIRIWNHAHSGQTASVWTSGTSVWTGAVTAIQPALVVYMMGTNDWRTATGPLDAIGYANNIKTGVSALRAVCTTPPSVLLIAPYKPATGTNTGSIGFQRFNRALLEVPKLMSDVMPVNLYSLMGGEGLQASQLGLLIADGIHPSDKGHQFITDVLIDKLAPQSPVAPGHLFMPSTVFVAGTNSPTQAALNNNLTYWNLNQDTQQVVVGCQQLPPSWRAVDVDVLWFNNGAGTGAVRWRVDVGSLAAGGSANPANTQFFSTQTAAAQNVLQRFTIASGVAVDPSQLYRFLAIRVAADAADTLTNTSGFVGFVIKKSG